MKRTRKIIVFLVFLASTLWASGPGHAVPIPTHGPVPGTHFDLFDPGVGPGPGYLLPSQLSPFVGGNPPLVFPPITPAVGTPFPPVNTTGCGAGLALYIAPPGMNVGGLACSFIDALGSPAPWHWETKISSPGGAAFFVGWFVGGLPNQPVPIVAGNLIMPAGSVFYMDIDFLEATFGLPETSPALGPFSPPYFMAFQNGTGGTLGFDGSVTEGGGGPAPAIFVPPGPQVAGISPITGLPITGGFVVDPPTASFILDPSVVPFLLPGLAAGTNLQVVAMVIPEPSSLFLLGSGLVGLLAYGWRQRGPSSGSSSSAIIRND